MDASDFVPCGLLVPALVLVACLGFAGKARAADAAGDFIAGHAVHAGGPEGPRSYPYRLLVPKGYDPRAREAPEKWPLILFLHGAGERGSDNGAQLKYFPELMASAEHREKYPAFVLAPQCPAERSWSKTIVQLGPAIPLEAVISILDSVIRDYPVDRRRIYLTGLSMGGYGSWELASLHPRRWAAVVPICAGGDPGWVERFKTLPIWAFQGAKDPVVPPERSREMIDALKKAGGDPRYTEFPDAAHDSWTPAYNHPELLPWLFRQKRRSVEI